MLEFRQTGAVGKKCEEEQQKHVPSVESSQRARPYPEEGRAEVTKLLLAHGRGHGESLQDNFVCVSR